MLRVSEVHKSFETEKHSVEVLRGVSLEMQPGHALAITGPSGSGKSTRLHLIGALDEPTSGRIEIGGREAYRLPEPDLARFRNQTIGFVFQDHHLLPQYSVLENVLIPTLAFSGSDRGVEDRARTLLERVNLAQRLDHRPRELASADRLRVLLARALVHRPDLLVLDEPCAGLDIPTREGFLDILKRLPKKTGIIYVTHHIEEILPNITHVMLLKKGKIFAQGKKEEVLTGPRLSKALDCRMTVEAKGGRYWVTDCKPAKKL